MNNKVLSETEQELLSKYLDDECTSNERVRAEQLLRTSESATLYLNDLKSISSRISNHIQSSVNNSSPALFWNRVSARIEQEERLALLVGERENQAREAQASVEKSAPGWFSSVASWLQESFVVGGLSGAIATAALLLVANPFSQPTNQSSFSAMSAQGGSFAPAVSPVNFGGNSNSFNQDSMMGRSPIEVDWMRGNGRVTLVQNQKGNSPIIWVNRRNKARQANPLAAFSIAPEENKSLVPLR